MAKDTVELALWPGEGVEGFDNEPSAHEALVQRVREQGVGLVVLEASGGYEFALACALQAAGVAVALINPRQARDFGKAMGYLAKTDAIDARVLAQLAQVIAGHPNRERFVKVLADAEQQRLQALVLRRSQLIGMLQAGVDAWPQATRQRVRASRSSLRQFASRSKRSKRSWPATLSATMPMWRRCCKALAGWDRPPLPP